MASNPTSPLASDPAHPAATAMEGVNLLDTEHAGIELPLLLPNQVDNLDWITVEAQPVSDWGITQEGRAIGKYWYSVIFYIWLNGENQI